jgi:mycothiol S-conjugate amidase
MNRTLVAIHAHPDDESSKGAGTVARYADLGVRCVLVTATGGEAGDILNPAMDRPEIVENLPAVRRVELEKAAALLGFSEIVHLGFRDSGMPGSDANAHPDAFVNADTEVALNAIVAVIRRERPQVILGYDSHEYYPHPDHLRVHELATKAFAAAADTDAFPVAGPPWQAQRLYAPIFSRQRLVALDEAMKERDLESPLGRWLARFPEEADTRVDARIDITTTLSRARDALRAHATQVDPDGFWFQIPEEIVIEAYPYEDFALLAGTDSSGSDQDLFAGL